MAVCNSGSKINSLSQFYVYLGHGNGPKIIPLGLLEPIKEMTKVNEWVCNINAGKQ